MNIKRNKKYFEGKKTGWATFMFILAGILSVLTVALLFKTWNTEFWYLPVISVLVLSTLINGAVLILIFQSIKVMSDNDYDRIIQKELADFQSEAIHKLEIPQTGMFVEGATVLEGYCYGEAVSAVKKGKDGVLRTNLYEKTLLIFAKDWLWVYASCVDTIKGVKYERLKFYRYENIISTCLDIENEKAVFRIIAGNDNSFRCYVQSSSFGCQVAARVQNIINKKIIK